MGTICSHDKSFALMLASTFRILMAKKILRNWRAAAYVAGQYKVLHTQSSHPMARICQNTIASTA